jgi:hypothetical protein
MANSIEWQPPVVEYKPGPGGEAFIMGMVPALTPETYDPALATEKFEKAEASASIVEAGMEIDALHELFKLDLGEELL